MEDQQQVYVLDKGKPLGPITVAELRRRSPQPADFVRLEGKPEFQEIRELPDLCTYLGLVHERTAPQYFASLDVRLLAAAIDFFILFFLYLIYVFISLRQGAAAQPNWNALIWGLALIPILSLILSTGFEASQFQGTPGKFLLKLKVTDTRGNPIGTGRALLRNLAKVLGWFTLGIGFLTGFFDRRQQCLHDKVARTLVVKDRLI